MIKHQTSHTTPQQPNAAALDETAILSEMSTMISSRIEHILREKGMSHKDLADATHHSQGEVSRWMNGTHNFTLATLAKISVALGVNILTL